MILLAGSSHSVFAKALASSAQISFGDCEVSTFPNGEKRVWITAPVTNQDVVIVQSLSDPVDSHIMELSLLADAAERAGARSITAIIPWMGYSLQDKVFRAGEPIAARVVANMVSASGVKRIILMDLHNNSVAGFFSVPTTVLSSLETFVADVQAHIDLKHAIVISPDFGGLKRAAVFAERLGVELANIDKMRDLQTGKVTARFAGGDITGKTCIVTDDCINTGSTIVEVAHVLKKHGASKVMFYATHALLAGKASELLQESDVDEVVASDTIAIPSSKQFKKLRIISVVDVFAHAVKSMI